MPKAPVVFCVRFLAVGLTLGLLGRFGTPGWCGGASAAPPAVSPADSDSAPKDPAPQPAGRKRIDRLIEQLGDKDYFVRQRAQEELHKLGFEAFDALSAALSHEDLEIAARAKYLIRTIHVQWTTSDDPPEVRDLLEDYEALDADNRRVRMRALAQLVDDQGLRALCRLARFEKSLVLSKCAAVELLRSGAAPPTGRRAEALRKMLARSNRPAVHWLGAWLQPADDPQGFVRQWAKLIETERQVLQRSPVQSRPQIVAALRQFQIAELERRGEKELADRALRWLIAPENVKAESLQELLDWLVEHKAWPMVAELLARNAARAVSDPLLMYTCAQAKAEQGKTADAEELAGRALRMNPGTDPAQLLAHRRMAYELDQRGLFRWAQREFDYLLKQKDQEAEPLLAWSCAEMLHEHGEDLRAAQVIETIKPETLRQMAIRNFYPITAQKIRARKHYLYACHWLAQNDRAKQRQALEKAYLSDPDDIEVLIACYRLPEETPEFKRKIAGQIRQTASQLRELINAQPGEHENYNEYAWLIANTEGDLDEALKFSQESLKLVRKSAQDISATGGYLDTLARVYYARGEYATAVKIQTHALRLDSHTPQIAQQLELFKKTLAEKEHHP
ncbi:MAG: hypothetical protein JXB10_13980 [Pirellulales bacterium]|nr:hypothetical protein [Pirellulales bacterium]